MTADPAATQPVSSQAVRHVLMLGAGLVARPGARYLLGVPWIRLTIADLSEDRASRIVAGHERGQSVAFDIDDDDALDALVAEHDLVISLLPAPFHPRVAEACLRHRKHMATASYIGPEMRALHERAADADLLFLNEIGVDPGIDHMSAMRIFDDAWAGGGRITVFKSYCGGLPAPDSNDNPMGYKFSWAPRGVLTAANQDARYKWDGEVVEVPGHLLLTHTHPLEIAGAGTFEAYPNRDSLVYRETYRLGDVDTLFRGTLRTLGHCARWKSWLDLGLFDTTPVDPEERTRAGLVRAVLGLSRDADVRAAVAERLGVAVDHDHVAALAWLGLFDDVPLGERVDAPVDAMAEAMVEHASYQPHERDMIAMHHEVVADYGDHRERTIMDLVDFGIPNGDSSMARTVTLPLAVGVRMMLEGRFKARGVHAPVIAEIYEPILDELETLGIVCRETTERLD